MGNSVNYFVTCPNQILYENINQHLEEFHVGDRIIYTEFGMRLKGIITKKHQFNFYSIMQDNGIYERIVELKYLELNSDFYVKNNPNLLNTNEFYPKLPSYDQIN